MAGSVSLKTELPMPLSCARKDGTSLGLQIQRYLGKPPQAIWTPPHKSWRWWWRWQLTLDSEGTPIWLQYLLNCLPPYPLDSSGSVLTGFLRAHRGLCMATYAHTHHTLLPTINNIPIGGEVPSSDCQCALVQYGHSPLH